MPKEIYAIRLRAEEHQQLRTYVNRGQRSARSINRARILL